MVYLSAIRAILTPGPKVAPPGGATSRCCPISARAGVSRPTTRSLSTGRRAIPPARSCATRYLPAARQFVEAVVAAGIPRGDYNGRGGDPAGLVSLSQTTTGHGKRSSTYWAFLAGEPEQRSNLTLITGRYEARDPGRPARARERILGQSGAVSGSFASRTPRRTRRSPARCFRSRAPSYA